MPYASISTKLATDMIKSHVDSKAEHTKLGKSRSKQEQLLKLAKEIDASGVKIAGVLAKLIEDAGKEHDRMSERVDSLLKQATAWHAKATQNISAANKPKDEVLRLATQYARELAEMHAKAVEEDGECNEALMAVNRSFNPTGLDEKYSKAFMTGRLTLHANSKRTKAKLDKLEQLASLCKTLQKQAALAFTAQVTDAKVAQEVVEKLAAKVDKLLEEDRRAAGQARKRDAHVQQVAAQRQVDPKSEAMCSSISSDCDLAYKAARNNYELVQAKYAQAKRQFGALAAVQLGAIERRIAQWPTTIEQLAQLLEANLRSMAQIRKRVKA